MSEARLPGGGKAWFVRRGSRWCYQVTPVSPAGWILSAVYVLAAVTISLFFLGDEERAGTLEWVGWAVLLTAATILLLVVVFNMSAHAGGRDKRRR